MAFLGATFDGIEVFTDPSSKEFSEIKQLGIIRFFIYKSVFYIWDGSSRKGLHATIASAININLNQIESTGYIGALHFINNKIILSSDIFNSKGNALEKFNAFIKDNSAFWRCIGNKKVTFTYKKSLMDDEVEIEVSRGSSGEDKNVDNIIKNPDKQTFINCYRKNNKVVFICDKKNLWISVDKDIKINSMFEFLKIRKEDSGYFYGELKPSEISADKVGIYSTSTQWNKTSYIKTYNIFISRNTAIWDVLDHWICIDKTNSHMEKNISAIQEKEVIVNKIASDIGNVYHGAAIGRMVGIIKDNKIYDRTKQNFNGNIINGISTSRDAQFSFGWAPDGIVISLDESKIKNRYKIKPTDFFSDPKNSMSAFIRQDEKEDFIFGKLDNLSLYLTGIYIPMDIRNSKFDHFGELVDLFSAINSRNLWKITNTQIPQALLIASRKKYKSYIKGDVLKGMYNLWIKNRGQI
jgi:hypothetical protein